MLMVCTRQGASGVRLCSIATNKIHETGVKHRAKEQQQQQAAAARSSFQQQLNAMQQRAERERTSKMHDPGLRALFLAVVKALLHGRPITDVPFEREFLLLNQAPHVPDHHWGVGSSSYSGCSNADKLEPVSKKQASEPATVASNAAEFWAQLESKGGCFRCPEWLKLAELVLVMVPDSVEDERMCSALTYLRNPLRSSLKEKHVNVCAREFKSMESGWMSYPYPDAIGRWLDAKNKRGQCGL